MDVDVDVDPAMVDDMTDTVDGWMTRVEVAIPNAGCTTGWILGRFTLVTAGCGCVVDDDDGAGGGECVGDVVGGECRGDAAGGVVEEDNEGLENE